jgi:zinc protease
MRLTFASPSHSYPRVRPRGLFTGLGAVVLIAGGLLAPLWSSAATGLPPIALAASGTASPLAENDTARAIPVRTLEGIDEYRLPNGLQVLLVPDASKPVVTVQLTVRAGSLQDPAGASGAMHVLEHLMFRARDGQGPAYAAIAQRGIRANATTTHDRTTFFASFAADADVQRWYLDWLAGAFADGRIEPEQLAGELGPVRNEMQGAQGWALGVAIETAMWALYGGEGYGRAPIGRLADIESLDASRLVALRVRHYRPDNATLVVAGAFDAEQTLRAIARDFGALPQGPAQASEESRPKRSHDTTTAQSLLWLRPGVGPMIMAAVPGPATRDADAAAARLLVYALTRDPSGLLNRRLVDRGIAARVQGQARAQAEGGTLLFAVQPAAGQPPAAVADALRTALTDAAALTPEQVEQARHGWMAEWRRRFNDPERLAEDLSEAVGRGDWRLHLADYARMRTLGPQDLRRVASEWLNAPLIVSVLPADASAAPVARASTGTISLPEQTAGATKQARSARSRGARSEAAIDPQTRVLADDRLALSVVQRRQRGGAVLARLAIPMLPAASSQEQTRAAGLLAAMLGTFRGTPDGAEAFQYALDRIETGLSVGFFSQELLIDIQTSADRFDAAMARVRTLLEADRFQDELLDVEKRKWRGRLDRAAQDPPTRLGELLSRHGSPYGQSDVRYVPTIEEEMASLQRIRLADIGQARAALLPLRGARVAVVGDIDAAAVAAAMERHLKPLLAGAGSRAPELVDDLRQAPEPKTLIWRANGTDSAFLTWAAFLPLREGERDALALALANRMFGQQGSGRLWSRLREREGLSYGAWSEIDWNAHAASSSWRASASFAAGDLFRVERVLSEELAAVERNGFDPNELARAKTGYLQEQQRLAAQPSRLLRRQLDALRTGARAVDAPLEQRISELSLDQVNAAWRRYIRADQFVRALAGKVLEETDAAVEPAR